MKTVYLASVLALYALGCSSNSEAPTIPAGDPAPVPTATGSTTTDPPPSPVPSPDAGGQNDAGPTDPDAGTGDASADDAASDAASDAAMDDASAADADAGDANAGDANAGDAGDAAVDSGIDAGPTNQAPTVSITSPTAASSYGMPVTVGVTVAAADADGTIASVQFYADGTLLGTRTAPPYHVGFEPSAAGSVSLTAKATDDKGAVTTSSAISITIGAKSPKIFFVHTDALGTPRLMADASKKTVWRWDQDEPFGDSRPNEDPDGDAAEVSMPLRFAGQYFDEETGLSANGFRDYAPELGRYIESDPVGLIGGPNTYAYVSGSPITQIDARGTTPWTIAGGLGMMAVGGLMVKFGEPNSMTSNIGLGLTTAGSSMAFWGFGTVLGLTGNALRAMTLSGMTLGAGGGGVRRALAADPNVCIPSGPGSGPGKGGPSNPPTAPPSGPPAGPGPNGPPSGPPNPNFFNPSGPNYVDPRSPQNDTPDLSGPRPPQPMLAPAGGVVRG